MHRKQQNRKKKKNDVLFYNPFVKAATVRKRIISTVGAKAAAPIAAPLASLRRHVLDAVKK